MSLQHMLFQIKLFFSFFQDSKRFPYFELYVTSINHNIDFYYVQYVCLNIGQLCKLY